MARTAGAAFRECEGGPGRREAGGSRGARRGRPLAGRAPAAALGRRGNGEPVVRFRGQYDGAAFGCAGSRRLRRAAAHQWRGFEPVDPAARTRVDHVLRAHGALPAPARGHRADSARNLLAIPARFSEPHDAGENLADVPQPAHRQRPVRAADGFAGAALRISGNGRAAAVCFFLERRKIVALAAAGGGRAAGRDSFERGDLLMRILITGGSGFVGAQLAFYFAQRRHRVTVMDNLVRRGSELNLPLFQREGIAFVHGDVRNREDFANLEGAVDAMVDASAQPSAVTGFANPVFDLTNN